MPQVTYVETDGTSHVVDVSEGHSLMEGAVKNGVPGIEADCGGVAACATCHVYIGREWQRWIPPREELEVEMLDCANEVNEDSRLSCQVAMTADLHGIVVRLPESQR